MDDEHDPLPAILAEIDQAIMVAPHVARLSYAMYAAYVQAGFTDIQALDLTIATLERRDIE